MKVEVAVLIVLKDMVCADVKQHRRCQCFRAQELCESRGGRPRLPVPNNPYGLCGRKATLSEMLPTEEPRRAQEVGVWSWALMVGLIVLLLSHC